MCIYNVYPGMIPILLTNYISCLQRSWVVCTYPQRPRTDRLFMARTDSRVVIRNSEASGLVRSKACDSAQLTMAIMSFPERLRRLLSEPLSVAWAIAAVFVVWKGMYAITNSAHPIVIRVKWSRRCTGATSLCCGIINSKFVPATSRWCGFLAIPCRWSTVLSRSLIRFSIRTAHQGSFPFSPTTWTTPHCIRKRGHLCIAKRFIGLVRGFVPCIRWATLVLKNSPWLLYTATAILLVAGVLW
jgi:hypothetical protein